MLNSPACRQNARSTWPCSAQRSVLGASASLKKRRTLSAKRRCSSCCHWFDAVNKDRGVFQGECRSYCNEARLVLQSHCHANRDESVGLHRLGEVPVWQLNRMPRGMTGVKAEMITARFTQHKFIVDSASANCARL